MIRLCPNCNTERSVTEFFCEGMIDGHNCGWDLSSVDVTAHGTRPPKTTSAEPVPTTPTCRNGHPNSPGDLICSVCGEPVEEHDHPTPIVEPMVETEPEPEPESIETIVDGWRLHHRIVASSSVRERFVALHEADWRRGV